jgi:hypothetical protein
MAIKMMVTVATVTTMVVPMAKKDRKGGEV